MDVILTCPRAQLPIKSYQSTTAADLNKLFPFSRGASCQHGRLNHQSRRRRPLACRDSFSCPTVSTPASL